VTGSTDLARHARNERHVVVTLDDHALTKWVEAGARNLAETMSPEFMEQTGPAGLLLSTFPELADVLGGDCRHSALCQPVAGLKLVIAGHPDDVPCIIWENVLLCDL